MITQLIKFLKSIFKIETHQSEQEDFVEKGIKNIADFQYDERPFYILKYPILKKQWREIMPYDNSSVYSWRDMLIFIEKLNNFLGITLEIPRISQWQYASKTFGYLKNNISKADISFWTYNRPYGTIINPDIPSLIKFEPCEGTELLPGDLYIANGNGHDAIALSLITYDNIEKLVGKRIFNSDDFVLITT